jgi:hypothetical protein
MTVIPLCGNIGLKARFYQTKKTVVVINRENAGYHNACKQENTPLGRPPLSVKGCKKVKYVFCGFKGNRVLFSGFGS